MKNQNGQWETFTLEKQLRKSRTYLLWTRSTSTQPPDTAIPTEVLHTTNTRITVANPFQSNEKAVTQALPQTIWYKTTAPHTSHLIGNISMIMEDEDISSIVSRKSIFEFASDGGHDPSSGILTFGWVAAINSTIIAQCRGPAQCHPVLAESFRAEGYGIASVAIFARNLVNRFKINKQNHEWIFYLDNQSMIQRISSYSHLTVSKWNLRPDEDITKLAFLMLQPIPHQLIHVKSHQDASKDFSELPFPAIINIMADQQATRQRSLMVQPATEVQNIASVQLRIKEMCITRDSQKWLLQSAGRIPIQNFFNDKYGWSESTFNSIAWEVQYSALKSFPASDQTRILKFVHGWLPTAARAFKEGSASSPRCPICHAPREDNLHLFQCNNKEMELVQEKLQLYLVKDMHDQGDSEISNIIEIGILNANSMNNWSPSTSTVSQHWKPAVREQSKIGWSHILRGRLSKSLISAMNKHYESQELNGYLYNGNRWAKKLITTIWTIMLELWRTRNSIIYNTTLQDAEARLREQIESKIRKCYEWSHILSARERNHWFSATLEDKLQEDPSKARNWLQGASRLIKIAQREQRQQPKESAILEKFLSIPRRMDHQQPRENLATINPRAFPQELNPD
jgi:hypothetical protein